jgi:NADH-quinone oxidoreductase subunit I
VKKKSLLGEIIYTFTSLITGLRVTFSTFWRKKVTLQYPEERWELPEGYRGMPALPVDPKTGKPKCIACGSCARICPEQIITIEHEVGEDKKRKLTEFKIDMSRCMFCGLCTESCPTGGLQMSKTFELSSTSRDQMVFDLEQLKKIGGTLPQEPEQEKPEEESSGEDQKPASGGDA